MRILVLVKPVVHLDTAVFREDYSIERTRSRHAISPSDAHALTLARKTKSEVPGSSITVISMASIAQKQLLESLKAYEVDALIHVCDRVYAQSDTLATARILFQTIKKQEPFSLILSGQQSTDAETGQVPAEVATLLGYPFISSIISFSLSSCQLTATRYLETERQIWKLNLPASLSVCSKGQGLEPPSLTGLRNARNVPTIQLDNNDLKLTGNLIGLLGSPTTVIRSSINQMDRRQARFIDDAQEGARLIWETVMHAHLGESDTIPLKEDDLTVFKNNDAIVVLSFLFDPIVLQTSLEILSHTAKLENPAAVLVLGSRISETQIRQFSQAGAGSITFVACSEDLDDTSYALLIQANLSKTAHTVLGGASIRMRSCMSVLAALTSSGLAADCTEFSIDSGSLEVIRPAFGGNLEASIGFTSTLQMATIRPNAYPVHSFMVDRPIQFKAIQETLQSSQWTLLDSTPLPKESLASTSVVFSIGNGIQDEDLRRDIFAFGFGKAASRVAVNAFGLDYSLQVGQTGRLIQPKVYVGFGIHGAFQHIVGIKQAKTIIAVNHDPKAPIFDYADYAIRCNADKVVKQLKALFLETDEGGVK